MKKLMMGLWLAGATLWAQPPVCKWRVQDVHVSWTAFKTPLKIGVSGTFDNIKLKAKPNVSKTELFRDAHIRIQTGSVSSGSFQRDKKIARAFFAIQKVDAIDADVIDVSDDNQTATLQISMNGVTHAVPVRLIMDDTHIEGKGVLDLADFDMLPSLQGLTDACKKPHEGKTWQDVEIAFELTIDQKCR